MTTAPPPPLVPPAAVAALRRTVVGTVAYPADPAYDALLGLAQRPCHPALVVDATSETDVLASLVVARAHGLGDAVLVLTRHLRDLTVDPSTGRVTAAAGAAWHDVHPALSTTGDVATSWRRGHWPDGVRPVEARTARTDGFVHTVAPGDPGAPGDVLTAVVLDLDLPTHRTTCSPITTTSNGATA